MRFQVLGDLAVWDDAGRPVVISGPSRRGLLAILLLRANEVVVADRLIDELWGERPPATAAKSLQVHVWRLRAALGADGGGEGRLATQAGGYVLRVEPGELDLDEFERLLGEGREALADHRPQDASAALTAALALWRGPPMSEFGDQPFAATAIARLEEQRLEAIEARIEADLALGRHRAVTAELDSLIASNPLREGLRKQLMLALYRCGRQADALAVFRDTRKMMSEELGLEPSNELRALERAVLDQDPALDLPAGIEPEPPRPAPPDRDGARPTRLARRSLLVGGPALAAIALVVILVAATGGAGGKPSVSPNSVAVIDASSNRVISQIPVGLRPSELSFGDGRLWVANLGDGTVSEIDPQTRQVAKTLAVGSSAQTTVAGVAAGSGAVWTVDGDGVMRRVDLSNDLVSRSTIGTPFNGSWVQGPDTAVLGAGAAWFVAGRSSLARLDLKSGAVTDDIALGTYPASIAIGFGSVWVSDSADNTVSRIDTLSSAVTQTIPVGRGTGGIASGAGAVWVSNSQDDTVARIDPTTGAVTDTIPVAGGPRGIAVGAGSVWVAASRAGALARIDPATRRVVATIQLGQSPEDVAVRGRSVFVSMQPGATTFGPQHGGLTLRIASRVDPLPSTDPALGFSYQLGEQLEYLTCATLLDYPDRPAPAGSQLVPEVARALPTVSADGRTYTFTLRSDFRFSPPSGARVTPQAFVRALERALNPRIGSYAGSLVQDIVGAQAYGTGRASTIAGVTASGDTLTIRLLAPAPDFPARVSTLSFCAIPPSTAIDPKGVEGVPTAGPYYFLKHVANQRLVLARNPYYPGARPHIPTEIDVAVGVGGDRAVAQVQNGSADYAPNVPPAATRALLARYGPASAAARAGDQQYFSEPTLGYHFLTLNTRRPLFASAAMRRAVNLAIDRRALSAVSDAANPDGGEQATAQYLQPGIPGYSPAAIYPLGAPDVAAAKRLARGHGRHGVIYAFTEPPGPQLAQIVKTDLHAIGVEMDVKLMGKPVMFQRLLNPHEPFDIASTGWSVDYPDPYDELNRLFDSASIPPFPLPPNGANSYVNLSGFADPAFDRRMRTAALLSGAERRRVYGRLAIDLARNAAPVAAWGIDTTRDFFAKRIGCETYQPIYGFDLASLCAQAVRGK